MAYIYLIINDINLKIYVGKTEFSILKRFAEHCRESRKERCEKRSLYKAMLKYGLEHFHISLLEETDKPEEREQYWILRLGTFKYGYNATMGGEGKRYIDYKQVCDLYNLVYNQAEVARILSIDQSTVGKILKENKIQTHSRGEYSKEVLSKTVLQYDKTRTKLLNTYNSSTEAAIEIIKLKNLTSSPSTIAGHIRAVCNGKRKTAYDYYWSFL